MQVKKQQVEPYMEQLTGSKLRMEYDKSVYCHPLYLTHTQNTLCKMPDLMNYKLESRLPGERSKTSVMQMILLEWKKVKSLLVKVKKNSEKVSLKLKKKKKKKKQRIKQIYYLL